MLLLLFYILYFFNEAFLEILKYYMFHRTTKGKAQGPKLMKKVVFRVHSVAQIAQFKVQAMNRLEFFFLFALPIKFNESKVIGKIE